MPDTAGGGAFQLDDAVLAGECVAGVTVDRAEDADHLSVASSRRNRKRIPAAVVAGSLALIAALEAVIAWSETDDVVSVVEAVIAAVACLR